TRRLVRGVSYRDARARALPRALSAHAAQTIRARRRFPAALDRSVRRAVRGNRARVEGEVGGWSIGTANLNHETEVKLPLHDARSATIPVFCPQPPSGHRTQAPEGLGASRDQIGRSCRLPRTLRPNYWPSLWKGFLQFNRQLRQ